MTEGFTLSTGATFAGDYRIVRPLSAGGMGAVYVAQQISTARERALKIMLGDMASNDDLRRRFAQEATVGAQIESEHVVEVVGAGIDSASGMPWLAMELLQGEDLAAYLRRSGPLAASQLLELFEQLNHAIAAAHAKQIVHRDLKPENIFLAKTRRAGATFMVKVLDFGIAKLMGQVRTSATGAMGTPLWMAPEQTQAGAGVTPAADVWALGLIAFRALVGHSYWRAAGDANSSSMMVLREVVMDPLVPASVRSREFGGPALPPSFDAWFARCVDRDISKRFPNAAVLQQELVRAMQGGFAGVTVLGAPVDDAMRPSAASYRPASGPQSAHAHSMVTPPPHGVPMPPPSAARSSKGWPLYAGLGLLAVALVAVVLFVVNGKGATKKSSANSDDDAEAETRPAKEAARPIADVLQEVEQQGGKLKGRKFKVEALFLRKEGAHLTFDDGTGKLGHFVSCMPNGDAPALSRGDVAQIAGKADIVVQGSPDKDHPFYDELLLLDCVVEKIRNGDPALAASAAPPAASTPSIAASADPLPSAAPTAETTASAAAGPPPPPAVRPPPPPARPPPPPPPPPPDPKSKCGCATGDLMCAMKCSSGDKKKPPPARPPPPAEPYGL